MDRKIIAWLTVFVLFFSTAVSARTVVEAEQIIQQINQGLDIYYRNAVIEGELDLITDLSNLFFEGDQRKSYIMSKLSFEDCIFAGEVIGYYHHSFSGVTYQANFEDTVSFKNCQFKQGVTFKYSSFLAEADFADCSFEEGAEFKYSKFNQKADFSGSRFADTADFKYAKFRGETSFERANFAGDGIFKYSEFPSGVNFSDSLFSGFADFKYTKFFQPLTIKGMKIAGNSTFKYAQVAGQPFNQYLLNLND